MLRTIGIASVVNNCAESFMSSEVYSTCCPAVDAATGPVLELFHQLSEVLFWIKDADLKIQALNTTFAQRLKRSPQSILGQRDSDLYYPELARVFMEDDREILRSGVAQYRKVELLTTSYGGVEWRSTTKLPIRSVDGEILGTTGISRPIPCAIKDLPVPFQAFAQIVEYARANLKCRVSVVELAKFSNMSVSTLGRRFKQYLRLSPSEFLSQLRISHACQMLEHTPFNVSEIGFECGFENAAAFSRAFRVQMRQSPTAYRHQFA